MPLIDLLTPTLPVAQNHHRLREVVPQLCENHAESPTSCVHGDANPDNTIVTTGGAMLIDLETTHNSHPGLDLGRTVFLTALEAGGTPTARP